VRKLGETVCTFQSVDSNDFVKIGHAIVAAKGHDCQCEWDRVHDLGVPRIEQILRRPQEYLT
jgi:hypothetical protein